MKLLKISGLIAAAALLIFSTNALASGKMSTMKKVEFTNVMKDGKKVWTTSSNAWKAGDIVEITLNNTLDGPHGFEIPGHLKPIVVDAKKTVKVKIHFAKAGSYKFKCHLHPAHIGGDIVVK